MIEIHHHLIERIFQHAKERFPAECCGILLGKNQERKRVEELFETKNAEVRRSRDRYVIDGKNFLGADRIAAKKGLEIIGFYHSHIGCHCIPSSIDQELAWEGYSYLIVSLRAGGEPEFKCWVMEEPGKELIEERICELESDENKINE